MGAFKHAIQWRALNRSAKIKGIVAVAATVLGMLVLPFATASTANAASGDPVVTLESGTSGCNGVLPTPGSENTTKRLVAGNLEPGGTVTFQIAFPVDPADVAGRTTFVITDCVFIDGHAALKYSVSFVPNTVDFLLTFNLVIPPNTPVGAEYCNYAKTTAAPSTSQASNRKAGPACFHVGGDLRIIKQAAGDSSHTPLVGAQFTVTCTTNVTIPPVVISGLSGTTTYSGGAYHASGTADTGIIAIAGPEGTPCTVTETSPPAGYDLPANPTFHYTIPAATAGQETDYIDDPRTPNTTALVTDATDGALGGTIHDSATLSGATDDAGGTITFRAYGPSDATCSGTAAFTSAAITVSGNGTYGSGNFTPTLAGSYNWTAHYSGDVNNLASDEPCGSPNETSSVDKKTTLIATAASAATVGDPIHDTATLSGATAGAGGTITFTAYGPDDATCSGTAAFTSSAIPVSGNGNYGSGDFTPTAAGSYYWTAHYSGDANNLAADETCGSAGETSLVGKKPTLIATAASAATVGDPIHDTATLSGATADAGGTITFTLYGPSDTPDCSGTAVFTSDPIAVSGNGSYESGDFAPATAGSYYWTAHYSGDANNLAADDLCGATGETSLVGIHGSSVTTTAAQGTVGDSISDTATLSGALAPTGTITFKLYGPSDTPDCSGDAIFTSTVDVDGNGSYVSGSFPTTTAGSYYWTADYSGDGNNAPSSEACGADGETSVLAAMATSITTLATSGTVGQAIHDTATLTGATADATGTITFDLFGPDDTTCSGSPAFTSDPIAVDGNGDYESGNFTPTAPGSYNWTAHYSGDVNNLPSDEPCGAEGETSGLGVAATSATPSPTHQQEGQSVTPVAQTGAGPIGAELGWALAMLVLGGALALLGKRRKVRRTH